MAILKIARMGHPALLAPAKPVENPAAPEIQRLLADMAETLDDAGGVGLAAPQVHVGLRLFIYKVPASRAGEDAGQVPLTAVINPVLTPLGDNMSMDWEGCLSIPGLRAAVPRFDRLHLAALDAAGQRGFWLRGPRHSARGGPSGWHFIHHAPKRFPLFRLHRRNPAFRLPPSQNHEGQP